MLPLQKEGVCRVRSLLDVSTNNNPVHSYDTSSFGLISVNQQSMALMEHVLNTYYACSAAGDEPWPQDVAYALGSLGAKFPNILLEVRVILKSLGIARLACISTIYCNAGLFSRTLPLLVLLLARCTFLVPLLLLYAVQGNKRHPSWTMFKNFQSPPGRVRVLIKKPDGTPVDDRFPTKQKLLEAIAKAMPNHPARLQRIAQVNAMKQEHEAKIAAAIKSGATGAPKKKDEKKGKKK